MEVKIVSLSPWATQVLLDLDLDNWIAGCPHNALIPPDIETAVPVVTKPFDPHGAHKEKLTLSEMILSEWDVDMKKLREIQPSHIITEGVMYFTGLTPDDAEEILEQDGLKGCRLLDFYPLSLEDIFSGVRQIAKTFGFEKKGLLQVKKYQQTLKVTSRKYKIRRTEPVVGILRGWPWMQLTGRWMSDLVTMAGAKPLIRGDDLFVYPDTYMEDQPDIFIAADPLLSLEENKKKATMLDQEKLFSVFGCETKPSVFVVDGPVFYDHSLTGLDTALKILGEIIRNDPGFSERKGVYWEEAKVYNV